VVPERTGVLRYFVRVAEKIVWRDRPEDVIQYLPLRQDLPPGVEPRRLISIIFIPASVFDNPALQQVNPEYYPLLERGAAARAPTGRVSSPRACAGGRRRPFRYRHLGAMATIGRKSAVADFGKFRLSGFVAWLLWGLVHVCYLVGFRNRIAVMLDWLWAYLTFERGVRLITGHET